MMLQLNKAKSLKITRDLYREFIRKEITFAMPIPESEYTATMQNAFLETDPESLEKLEHGLNMLAGAVQWNGGNVADANQWNNGRIFTSLDIIEKGKLASIARYVNEEVKVCKNKKFVISCGSRALILMIFYMR